MKYLEWNNLISSYFFNKDNAGKNTLLYLTKNDIIKLARPIFEEETDEDIWNDFISSIKRGIPGSKGNIIAKAKYAYDKRLLYQIDNVRIKYPPYIAYLVFLVLPLIEEVDSTNMRANNYYGRLNDFLLKNAIDQTIGTSDLRVNEINLLWEYLSDWANIVCVGDFGLFEIANFSNENWVYVGKIFSQCVLPPKFTNKLPELFEKIGLVPNTLYDDGFLLEKIRNSKTNLIPKTTLDFLKKDDDLSKSIIQIVQNQYKNWTGETHEEIEEGITIRKRRNYTIATLFLQFSININDEEIKFSYRMRSQNDYPEDLKFGEYQNLYEFNGWSKTLPLDFKEALELKDNFNKWVARFPERDIRLFVSAGNQQLSSEFWIETDVLSKTDRMYLLCRRERRKVIEEWGETFNKGDFKQENFEGLPENYFLFWFRNPTQGLNDISILTLYTEKRIELVGGLKVNFRTYTNDFLPEVEIVNSEGNEKVYLQYKESDEKILLSKNPLLNNRLLLPDKVAVNTEFYINVEDESFLGNTLVYNLTSSDNTAIKVDGSKLPKRNSFGRNVIKEEEQYCLGSNIINPMKSSQRHSCPLGWIFTSTKQDVLNSIYKASFNNHNGNKLSSFLSLKNELTTEEFFKAFEFYYSKEFSEQLVNSNFNLTKLKRASLNFYDFIGILDYNYETKKIVLNPPQFIFVPTTKGRRVLLIGARDSALVEDIINIAPEYNLQVEITKQFSSNERLLLPDVITIKAFGSNREFYGERNIKALADELKITFSNDYFPQLALKDFSANLSDYENTLQEINEDDYDWARYIFNPETLRFEKSETETFDKSFSLLEYKLNEYTYQHRLWKDNKCYQIDMNWGRFVALNHFKKNVILFDDKSKRVAIPISTPLPRLLSEAIMLLSGLAPDFKVINGKKFRVYENVVGVFTQNLFKLKLGQIAINTTL